MENLLITRTNSKGLFMDDLNSLDFTMIKQKLKDNEEGPGWSPLQCEATEKEYKRFLALKRSYPEKDIVPHRMVDQFWHQHILDTEKYALDCDMIFGKFLHHYPYFGMNGEQDAQNLTNAFEETKSLYKKSFNDEYLGVASRCQAPKCRTQCKPMKCK
ncbi:MAG TPA: hypothetical protein VK498_06105 [Ferruginibacter sp.]|nr:hypothetical protein [Ferruginibacter sp.]